MDAIYFNDTRRWSTSVHEAAHLVIALKHGLTVLGAALRSNGDPDYAAHTSYGELKRSQVPFYIVAVLAGVLAQKRVDGATPQESGGIDRRIAASYAIASGLATWSTMPAYLREQEQVAEEELDERWDEITAVAMTLMRDGVVYVDKLNSI